MKDLDWNRIRAFHATATQGSLSGAARRLGLTQPTLSRQVASLEHMLGVTLFDRVGRKLVLTKTGEELLAHVRVMDEAANSMALAANGRVDAVGGRVSVSVTDTYAAYILPAIIERIRAEAPQIIVDIISTNSLSDLQHREADIAVRHLPPDQAGLTGRHLHDTSAHFYASADWIARNGMPADAAALASAGLIGFHDTERYRQYLGAIGIEVEADGFRLISDNSVAIWEMVRRGLGVAAMLREVAERTPDIVRLLPEMEPIVVPVWLVTHRELHTSRRIRLVCDILADELSRL